MKNHFANRKIITTQDYCRLTRLIQTDRSNIYLLQLLKELLKTSEVMLSESVPSGVVTMDTIVCLKDLRHGESQLVKMAYSKSTWRGKKMLLINVPILSPLGISLLGQQVGDVLMERIQIDKMVYQPETQRCFDR